MDDCSTDNQTDNTAAEHSGTNLEWLADLVIEAADTLRGGGKLNRRDYFAIARAALRMVGREAAK